jgi:CRP-like cAMP-binding protein
MCGRATPLNAQGGQIRSCACPAALPAAIGVPNNPGGGEHALSPRGNRLLASLSSADLKRLAPNLEEVELELAETLFEPEDRITHAYFPWQGAVSLLAVGQDGAATQVALVGREGLVGLGGLLAGEASFTRQTVQIPGRGARIARSAFMAAFSASEAIRDRVLAHADAFAAQNLQSAACNALHSVEERLARWLLTAFDRSGQPTFPVTHRALAELLGVQRPTVTLTVRMMDAAGLIRLKRGSIEVLNRSGLEELTCECYGIIKRTYDEAHTAG